MPDALILRQHDDSRWAVIDCVASGDDAELADVVKRGYAGRGRYGIVSLADIQCFDLEEGTVEAVPVALDDPLAPLLPDA
jgi:hypothetical protein